MIGVSVHHTWLCIIITRLSGDIEENPGPKRKSDQNHFLFTTGILTVSTHTIILKYRF